MSPHGGGMTASARQRASMLGIEAAPHLPKRDAGSQSCDRVPASAAVASGPTCSLLRKAMNRTGEEAALPGQPVALARVSGTSPGDSLSRFAGCRWLCRDHSSRLRYSHVSLNPLSANLLRPATQIASPLVQKLWTMCLPCGSPRKTKNKSSAPPSLPEPSQ